MSDIFAAITAIVAAISTLKDATQKGPPQRAFFYFGTRRIPQ
jgi:hypothetical protein